MKNYRQTGKSLLWTNSTGSAVVSGEMVVVGDKVGVAAVDIANGETGSVWMDGVFEIAKNVSEAFTQGLAVYWDDTAGDLTTTVGSNNVAGYITEAATMAATLALVRINQ